MEALPTRVRAPGPSTRHNPTVSPTPSPKRRGPRGVQLDEVVAAADQLLAQGLKPTIERVRQQLGGGSPNTVSPLLDVWYERLSARVAGVPAPAEDDLPSDLRSAWNDAKHEARTLANQALQEERAALAQGRAQLSADQAELAKREEQWSATAAAIDKALAESREASAALRGELALAQSELVHLRSRYDNDVDQLRASLTAARQAHETMRSEHGRTLEAREAAWLKERERLEAREAAHERRFLAEVDQARQSARLLETELAKERKRRVQAEEAATAERTAQRVSLAEARTLERQLREELQSQGVSLAQANGKVERLGEQLATVRQQLAGEAATHAQARATLAEALAAAAQRASRRRGQGGPAKKR